MMDDEKMVEVYEVGKVGSLIAYHSESVKAIAQFVRMMPKDTLYTVKKVDIPERFIRPIQDQITIELESS